MKFNKQRACYLLVHCISRSFSDKLTVVIRLERIITHLFLLLLVATVHLTFIHRQYPATVTLGDLDVCTSYQFKYTKWERLGNKISQFWITRRVVYFFQ